VPAKFRQLGTFYKYYSGEAVAPYPTIFIGGNHEAANYLWELYHGGWAAPNIYFMGYAGACHPYPCLSCVCGWAMGSEHSTAKLVTFTQLPPALHRPCCPREGTHPSFYRGLKGRAVSDGRRLPKRTKTILSWPPHAASSAPRSSKPSLQRLHQALGKPPAAGAHSHGHLLPGCVGRTKQKR